MKLKKVQIYLKSIKKPIMLILPSGVLNKMYKELNEGLPLIQVGNLTFIKEEFIYAIELN